MLEEYSAPCPDVSNCQQTSHIVANVTYVGILRYLDQKNLDLIGSAWVSAVNRSVSYPIPFPSPIVTRRSRFFSEWHKFRDSFTVSDTWLWDTITVFMLFQMYEAQGKSMRCEVAGAGLMSFLSLTYNNRLEVNETYSHGSGCKRYNQHWLHTHEWTLEELSTARGSWRYLLGKAKLWPRGLWDKPSSSQCGRFLPVEGPESLLSASERYPS